jgi:hypothetical protein
MFTDEEKVEIQQAIQKNRGPLIALPDNLAIRSLELADEDDEPGYPDGLSLDGFLYMSSEIDKGACRNEQEAKAKDLKERQVLAAEASLLAYVRDIAEARSNASRPVTLHFTASCDDDYAGTWTWWLARQLLGLADSLLSWRAMFVEGNHRSKKGSHICLPSSRWSPLAPDSDGGLTDGQG